MTTHLANRPARGAVLPGEGRDLLGRLADFTLGTAVVLWHAAMVRREARRRPQRRWSSTR